MLLKLAAIALLAGCPAPADECKLPSQGSGLGGTNDALEASLVSVDTSGTIVELTDGGTVPLTNAPQGGYILLVGARVHSDTTCQLDATGSLRDVSSNRVLGLDERALYLAKTGDGWSQPEAALSAMPNVAVCPNSATSAAVYGNPYQLELALQQNGDTVSDLKITVTPQCPADDTFCQSYCGATGSGS